MSPGDLVFNVNSESSEVGLYVGAIIYRNAAGGDDYTCSEVFWPDRGKISSIQTDLICLYKPDETRERQQALKEICTKAGLTAIEVLAMAGYMSGKEGFHDSSAFEKLFAYFAFDVGEMPYGTMKARTGDPTHWIIDRLRGTIT